MFTPASRSALRDHLVARAEADPDISAAALVGSAARNAEDAWSDIDLALSTRIQPGEVAAEWTDWLYTHHGVVHHLDVDAGGILYRVYLFGDSLQLDISFWPQDQFRATEPGFKLLFGTANEPTEPGTPSAERLIGWAWLYAIHARSAIARRRTWQAVMMLDELRDQVIALACLRSGLPAHHGRGVDNLPSEFLDALAAARAITPTDEELRRSIAETTALLQSEVDFVDSELASRLRQPLDCLAHP